MSEFQHWKEIFEAPNGNTDSEFVEKLDELAAMARMRGYMSERCVLEILKITMDMDTVAELSEVSRRYLKIKGQLDEQEETAMSDLVSLVIN